MSNKITLGNFNLNLPRSRIVRIALGVTLILGGILGFLPVLGFWMVPLGLLVLSVDLRFARRLRDRVQAWLDRRRGREETSSRDARKPGTDS